MPDDDMQVSPANLEDAAKGRTDTILVTHGKQGGRPVSERNIAGVLSQAGIKPGWQGKLLIAFPDVCKTPAAPSPVPIPYPNIGTIPPKGGKKVKIAETLRDAGFRGVQVHSVGSEAGSAKGLIGARAFATGNPLAFGMDVKAEGKPALMGHEMAHAIQQRQTPHKPPPSQTKVIK
ncbi:PAAR-like domain-containing protein [Vannielia litorea]|uniref:DUF4157 domain-containing protein n=1 Tax=Vannielia litorea TaxID=1217970 RepID=A0A1N6IFD2_9RHOB|nr:PAAR-like domain-containing protein [Vannielia litorea]SIO30645.1 protein of unknown function [Vannielia litorea]